MNTAAINVKIDADVKKQAQQVAEEEPSNYFIQALKESQENIKAGRVIQFSTLKDELQYLDKMIVNEKNSKRKTKSK